MPVDPPIELVTFKGIPSVFVEVRGIFSQRTDLYSESVLKITNAFKEELPEEISLELVFNEADFVEEKFSFLLQSILIATFLVLALSYISLGPRSAIIVSAVVPLTIFLVLILCSIFSIPLHTTCLLYTSPSPRDRG